MRIVSLLASATEMVAALGSLDQLVGRSHECDYPPEILSLPVVSHVQIDVETSSSEIDNQIKQLAHSREAMEDPALKALSIYAIDVEKLQDLKPDLILTQTQCEVCAVSERDVMLAVQQLTGQRPQILALNPYRLSDIWEDLERIGQALNKAEEARSLVQDYKHRLEALRTETAKLGSAPGVALLEWLDPLMTAGNWAPELIAYAGGKSLFGEIGQHSPWLTWEELQKADPEVLVLSPCGFTLERTEIDLPLLQHHPAWQNLQAVRNGRVYAIDGNQYLNRSGPRVIESAQLLARVIWDGQLSVAVDEQAWQPIRA